MLHASFGNLRVPLNYHKSTLRSLKKFLYRQSIAIQKVRKKWALNDSRVEKDACWATAEKLHVVLRQNMTGVSSLGGTIPSFGKREASGLFTKSLNQTDFSLSLVGGYQAAQEGHIAMNALFAAFSSAV